jgi:hypothetical protein
VLVVDVSVSVVDVSVMVDTVVEDTVLVIVV